MSSSAIYAKARAMQANLLTKEDYESLVHKASLSALIYELQQSKGYQEVMKEASTRLHRGALEALLHHILYQRFRKLSRYAFQNEAFFELVTLKQTMKLVHASIVLLPMHQDLFLQKLPSDVKKIFPYDVNALLACETSLEVCQFYQGSKFYPEIQAYLKHQDHVQLELDLSKWWINQQQKVIQKLPKKSQQKVLDYLGMESDLYHMEIIYRTRFHFQYDVEQIKAYLLPYAKKLKEKQFIQLMNCKKEDYFKLCRQYGYEYQIGVNFRKKYLYQYSKKSLYMENDPYLSYLCAILLFQNECDNICAIIEGIRYQNEPEAIMTHVIV